MIYKAPFYAVNKAIYYALSNSDIGLEWFDSGVPIEEVEDYFKNRSEFAYGVFTTATSDTVSNKDAVIWDSTLGIEIYSNYKGRKVIAQKLEALLNFLSNNDGWQKLSQALYNEGFALISVTVGNLTVNMPINDNTGIWQSGSTNLTLKLQQL